MLSRLFLALLASSVTGNGVPILPSPGINYTSSAHKAVDCNNVTTSISASCYTALDITSYLNNWNTTYRPELCSPSQTWSNCFMNYAYTNGTRIPITRENITKHDCSRLDRNSSSSRCPKPSPRQKKWTAQEYYSTYTIYNLQHHVFVWSQAIASRPGRDALAAVLNAPPKPLTPSRVLQAIITRFGIDAMADTALVQLLATRSVRPVAAVVGGPGGAGAVPNSGDAFYGESATGPEQWVPLLVNRLAEVLALAMRDFDTFLGVVDEGVYSGHGLALAVELISRMRRRGMRVEAPI